MWRFGRASDEEALKMVLAYLSIHDPARRERQIQIFIQIGIGAVVLLAIGQFFI